MSKHGKALEYREAADGAVPQLLRLSSGNVLDLELCCSRLMVLL